MFIKQIEKYIEVLKQLKLQDYKKDKKIAYIYLTHTTTKKISETA